MATYGQFSCPPTGNFSCPLTRVASVVFPFVRSITVTAQVTEAAGMAFREVSVNEIREVLRLWLGVAGLPAPGLRTMIASRGVVDFGSGVVHAV